MEKMVRSKERSKRGKSNQSGKPLRFAKAGEGKKNRKEKKQEIEG